MEALSSNGPVTLDARQYALQQQRNKSPTPSSAESGEGAVQQQPSSVSASSSVVNTAKSASETDVVHKAAPENTKDAQHKAKELDEAVNKANQFFEQVSRELRFQHSKSTEQLVVQIVDPKSGEVIRQLPSEEMLKISKELERITGLLFRGKA